MNDKNLQDKYKSSMQAIADHIRSTSFLIMDGIEPGNEGRSYVLRRIIRRALRHAYQLGHRFSKSGVFFCNLVYKLSELMGQAYPKLVEMQDQIKDIISNPGATNVTLKIKNNNILHHYKLSNKRKIDQKILAELKNAGVSLKIQ